MIHISLLENLKIYDMRDTHYVNNWLVFRSGKRIGNRFVLQILRNGCRAYQELCKMLYSRGIQGEKKVELINKQNGSRNPISIGENEIAIRLTKNNWLSHERIVRRG